MKTTVVTMRSGCQQPEHTSQTRQRVSFLCLYSVSIHRMAPPERGSTHPITAYYSFIDLERTKAYTNSHRRKRVLSAALMQTPL